MRSAGSMASASQHFYKWKSKYGGLDMQQLTKMKELEKELSQYKKIVAELTLENVVMKDVIAKKL